MMACTGEEPDNRLTTEFAIRPFNGRWARQYLYDRSMTIAGGTSEVQGNIVAQRILGPAAAITRASVIATALRRQSRRAGGAAAGRRLGATSCTRLPAARRSGLRNAARLASTWEAMGWFGPYETSTLRLEASTICQLACPSCATTHGTIKRQIGAGFLKFDDFRRIVDENPWVWEIELSNWGEIFLNPDIERIIAYAYRRSVALTAHNGANLNHVKESVLEVMVRYKFRAITCSIDGVSQGTYEAYRRRGQLDRVLANIRRLNDYKRRWKSEYPMLCWQMIAFGHNEHEIAAAQALARELGMAFCLKLNYDDNFSPVKKEDAIRKTVARTRLGEEELAGERDEYLTDDICSQLWRQPQINFDGALLGCCVNMWASFGENAFAVGVKKALEAEKLRYAKEMVQGRVPPRDDVPCTTCAIYLNRASARRWLGPPPAEPGLRGFLRRRGMGRLMVWVVNRRGRWLQPVPPPPPPHSGSIAS